MSRVDLKALLGRDLALGWWLLGVSVAHALRFVFFNDPPARQFIAVAGTTIYLLGAVLAVMSKSRWLSGGTALVFPLVGISSVLITGASLDDWQIAVGVTQVAAMLYVITRPQLNTVVK